MTDNGHRSRTPPAPQRFSTLICYERYEQKIIESPRPVFFRRRSVGTRATGPTAGGANRAARRDPYPRPVYPARRRRQHVLPVRDQPSRRPVPLQRVLLLREPRPERVDGPLPRFRSGRRLLGREQFLGGRMPCLPGQILYVRDDTRQGRQLARHGHIRGRYAERALQGAQQGMRYARRLELARRNAACGPEGTAMDGFLP